MPTAKRRPKTKATAADDREPQKLSFKYEHRARELIKLLPQLESELAEIEAKLHTPSLFTKEPDRFAALAKEMDAKKSDLAGAEEEWLEIEMMREEMQS